MNSKVSDKNSYQSVVKALREKTNQEDRVEKKLLLDEMIKDIRSLTSGHRKYKQRNETYAKSLQ